MHNNDIMAVFIAVNEAGNCVNMDPHSANNRDMTRTVALHYCNSFIWDKLLGHELSFTRKSHKSSINRLSMAFILLFHIDQIKTMINIRG